jgi:hypothetical protein
LTGRINDEGSRIPVIFFGAHDHRQTSKRILVRRCPLRPEVKLYGRSWDQLGRAVLAEISLDH